MNEIGKDRECESPLEVNGISSDVLASSCTCNDWHSVVMGSGRSELNKLDNR